MKTVFTLNTEYIELIKLLKLLGWSETGGQAKIMVESGCVRVDGQVEARKRCKLRQGQTVTWEDHEVVIASPAAGKTKPAKRKA